MENNVTLYETADVLKKYGSKKSRSRQLNNAERIFVDTYQIYNKKVLVLGSGAGRVPSNLSLFGNDVTAIELSKGLFSLSLEAYPPNRFSNIKFIHGDATDLSQLPDKEFDVTFFPMNGLDLIRPIENREQALREMVRKCAPGGLLAFASHNILACSYSYKVPFRSRTMRLKIPDFIYERENVVGGGELFKGRASYIIKRTQEITGCKYVGHTCDVRSRLDGILSTKLWRSAPVFPYILYVFRAPTTEE